MTRREFLELNDFNNQPLLKQIDLALEALDLQVEGERSASECWVDMQPILKEQLDKGEEIDFEALMKTKILTGGLTVDEMKQNMKKLNEDFPMMTPILKKYKEVNDRLKDGKKLIKPTIEDKLNHWKEILVIVKNELTKETINE